MISDRVSYFLVSSRYATMNHYGQIRGRCWSLQAFLFPLISFLFFVLFFSPDIHLQAKIRYVRLDQHTASLLSLAINCTASENGRKSCKPLANIAPITHRTQDSSKLNVRTVKKSNTALFHTDLNKPEKQNLISNTRQVKFVWTQSGGQHRKRPIGTGLKQTNMLIC